VLFTKFFATRNHLRLERIPLSVASSLLWSPAKLKFGLLISLKFEAGSALFFLTFERRVLGAMLSFDYFQIWGWLCFILSNFWEARFGGHVKRLLQT